MGGAAAGTRTRCSRWRGSGAARRARRTRGPPGSAALREAVDAADDEKVEGVIAEWESQLEKFAEVRRGFLLYD